MSWLAKALAYSSDVFSGTRNYLLMPPVIPGACSLGRGVGSTVGMAAPDSRMRTGWRWSKSPAPPMEDRGGVRRGR